MTQAAPAQPPATHQDVLDAPPNTVAEIIAGELHLHPRPRPRHAVAASALGGKLMDPFQFGGSGPGGWWILDEPELHLGTDVIVPDLAGWRRERLPEIPDAAYFTLAPDWVCAVSSPSTRARHITDKRTIYRREAIGHLWEVDPDARTLEAFAREDGPEGRWVLIAALHGDAEVRVPPFDAVGFDLGALWA